MARYARKRRRRRSAPLFLAIVTIVLVGWWIIPRNADRVGYETTLAPPSTIPLTSSRPEHTHDPSPTDVPERGEHQPAERPATRRAGDSASGSSSFESKVAALIESGRKALGGNQLVAARSHFSEALTLSTDPAQRSALRAELTRIGGETIFSPRMLPDDPHVERYVIRTGDSLGKIARTFGVTDDLIARINGLRDKNLIHVGQAIKVIRGPFRAVVDTSDYTLGLFLGDTFVRQFPVGLGQDDSTPRGAWQVSTKLVNPTYYPPRGGRIIAADDPDNPLGERWIGLHGVSGESVGQLRYGIHGTNEPESIGKSVSLGCIRMHNQDVEIVYDCLVEKQSTVIVR